MMVLQRPNGEMIPRVAMLTGVAVLFSDWMFGISNRQ